MIDLIFAVMLASTQPAAPTPPICVLTQKDKEANALLSFQEFDQNGTSPSSWRALGEQGCWQQAVEALQHYSINGPVAQPREQRIMLFHLGQSLAISGEERRAADFIAFSREPKGLRPPENTLNWNDYVTGTWAFLVKDKSLLMRSRDAVLAAPGNGNNINGNVLAGLARCFDKPYSVAYNPATGCQTE